MKRIKYNDAAFTRALDVIAKQVVAMIQEDYCNELALIEEDDGEFDWEMMSDDYTADLSMMVRNRVAKLIEETK